MTDQIEKLIIKKVHGECTREEELQLQSWLLESEENRNIYSQYKVFWQSQKMEIYSSESRLNTALNEYNRRIEAIRTKEIRVKIFKGLRWAATILILVCVPSLLLYLKMSESKLTLLTESVALKGDIKEITLTDGTKVWLNRGSSICYPSNFKNIERTLYLDGEAYLDVKKDPAHPFIVKTQAIQVKVFGTSFNINTKYEDNTVQTTLVEGSVVILDKNGKKLTSLNPGQMASVNTELQTVNLKVVNPKYYTSWRTGEVYFENAGIHEIISKIEEVYDIKIQTDTHLKRKSINQKKYNFIFNRNQPIDSVFEMLNFITPCKFVKKDSKQKPKSHPK